jgi:hypothetical protein
MPQQTRRQLLAAGAAPMAARFALPEAGVIKPRTSASIRASALSVGFETLDRKMFDPERCYDHLGRLGVKWARCQTGWSRTEQEKGKLEFGWLDDVVDKLLRQSIQPWFSVGFGNKLYTPDAPHQTAVGWHPMRSAGEREAWLRFVRAAAERYRNKVKYWEIWNEPNLDHWFVPTGADPAVYAEMVRITAPEIRKRVSGAVIVGGSLSGGFTSNSDYLERCLQAGLAQHADRISYHPYRPVPEANYENEVRALRAMLARFNPKIGVWQGENGCPSQSGSSGALRQYAWTEKSQAKWTLRRIMTDLRLEIELTSYFHTADMLNYFTSDGKPGPTNYKGLIRGTDYSPKPSYHALQNLAALFDSDTLRTDFYMAFSGPGASQQAEAVHSAAFVRNGRPLYAFWHTATPLEDHPEKRVNLTVRHGAAAKLDRPVLADLLTGRIHRIESGAKGGFVSFEGLPLTDWPVVVTDAALLSS